MKLFRGDVEDVLDGIPHGARRVDDIARDDLNLRTYDKLKAKRLHPIDDNSIAEMVRIALKEKR